MSLKRDVWVLPRLRARAVGAFLCKLAPHFGMAQTHDLRLRLDAEGNLVVLCPLPDGGKDLQLLHGRLAEAFEAAGRRGAELEKLPAQSRDISAEPALIEGILLWIGQQAQTVAADGPAGDGPETGPVRAIIVGEGGAAPADFAALVRRSRDARFLVGGAGVTLLDLSDDPGRGSTLSGLRASGLPAGVTLLTRHSPAAMAVWLPEGMAFAEDKRESLAAILNGLVEAGLVAPGAEVHLPVGRHDSGLAVVLPPDPVAVPSGKAAKAALLTDAAALAAGIDPAQLPDEIGPALRLSVLTLTPEPQAQRDLNTRLNDRAFPLGYRISLAPVGAISRSDEDIERLRSEIEEREARIALIQALGRPQLRLLRFTDTQLPALVDGLRKMPRALRENAGLRYAATHAAGRAEPVHFVVYDPETVQFEGVLPEFYWRAVTEDHPIGFWLDPHAEEARDGNPDEPMVFVPQGARILPNIDSFGASVKGTLQLVLGRLFADGSAVLEARGAQPAFVFRNLTGGRDEIGVELVDLARFAPLKVSLRWINDHILASSPRTADPGDLRELAETLYAGQLAREMRTTMQGEVEGLRIGWVQAQEDILGCLDDMAAAVAREVAQLRVQMETARRFVDLSRARLSDVTQSLNGLGATVGGLDSALTTMAGDRPVLAVNRIAFFDQYEAEYQTSQRLLEDTRTEITQLREKMDRLATELARE
ncbi:MAG: hypothetical protein Q7J57_10090 [Gemmobacter sp.]|nr:hypothetical protein [Gemmobacter sp.]